MALRTGQTRVAASLAAQYLAEADGFTPATARPSVAWSASPDAGTFDELVLGVWTVAAGGTQTVDLRTSINPYTGRTVTGARAVSLILEATSSAGDAGGKVRVRPGTTNPLTWFFGSTTDSLTLNVPASGKCGLALHDGSAVTVSNSDRNLEVSNPGSVAVVVKLAAVVGT